MEAIASKAASGTSSAREAARRFGLPPSSVRNILRRILQLYPYKLQSCYELLPADTAQREAFAKWAFSKREQDPARVFNILWTDEAHFSLHGDVNNHNCRIWSSSLSELKDAIRREVSSIHPDMLHSAVAGFVTRLECLLPGGIGHVEHILV
ncbi:uncharacterized protein TNCV_4496131 [Trichonephila clavipes]|nr:uncharacterized protein TNCV_4496131 [Trichonephila clavipes]